MGQQWHLRIMHVQKTEGEREQTMRITKYTTLLGESNTARLIKEGATNYPQEDRMDSPEKIVRMLDGLYGASLQTEEVVWLVTADNKMRNVGVFELSRGATDMSVIDARSVFMKALLCNARYIILAHDHPSGDPAPSKDDLAAMKNIIECGKMLGLPLRDFLIIGQGQYWSGAEEGFL